MMASCAVSEWYPHMVSVRALTGAATSPTSAPAVSRLAQSHLDRFGPATIVGRKATTPTVFVVYTARGTFSANPHVEPHTNGVTPTVQDYIRANLSSPIQRGIRTSASAANIPDQIAYNRQGQVVRQVTLFQSGTNYQYATGAKLLI